MAYSSRQINTPIPSSILPVHALDVANYGREVLASYCSNMINTARQTNNLDAYNHYSAIAKLLDDVTTGLVLGSLLYESQMIIEHDQYTNRNQALNATLDFYDKATIEVPII